ncbi:hypothetical protein DENSPDRAFT_745222, partial [Dentipellis sp. KUC8613]
STMSPSPSHKSLTPQRKHRKMLKDGTSEVWPESVEKVFVQGLRQYWDSPWATYSRGRSRWRNQFLVDYLHAAGVERSKKQVASHIQVLRNMWKGEPEYQLVAGGEELFQDTRLLPSRAPSKQYSPESVSSDLSVKEEQGDVLSPLNLAASNTALELTLPQSYFPQPSHSPTEQAYLTPLSMPSASEATGMRHVKAEPEPFDSSFLLSNVSSNAFASQSMPSLQRFHNSISALALWAEGMQPISIDVERLMQLTRSQPSSTSRVCIRLKLSLSTLDDVLSPPTLHGFQGTLAFAAPWTASAQCVTRVYAGGVCDSEESSNFQCSMSNTGGAGQPVTVMLPDSWLSRCKWRNANVPTFITQQILVDNEELALIVYDLERPQHGLPSAEFVDISRDRRVR